MFPPQWDPLGYNPSGASVPGGLFGSLMWIAIVIGAFVAYRTRRSFVQGPTLVLRKFEVRNEVDGPGEHSMVLIEGRASGLVAWILTNFGLDAETRLSVTRNAVSYRSASLAGELHQRVLRADVASTRCAYAQPLWLIVLKEHTTACCIYPSLNSSRPR